jgi:hypothetical protein
MDNVPLYAGEVTGAGFARAGSFANLACFVLAGAAWRCLGSSKQ